jgi:hypothetical protein
MSWTVKGYYEVMRVQYTVRESVRKTALQFELTPLEVCEHLGLEPKYARLREGEEHARVG